MRKKSLGVDKINKLLAETATFAVLPGQASVAEGQVSMLGLGELQPSPYQPRVEFDEEALVELASSIQQMGLLQPIVVRRTGGGDYQIVAGERRWRAAQHAGLTEIPCLIRELTDGEAQIAALVENIHRRDLSPYERGRALRRIREALDLSWEQVAERLGMSTRMIMRLARYAQIPTDVEQIVADVPMTMRHYEALAKLPDDPEGQRQVAEAITRDNLSGPEANRLALSLLAEGGAEAGAEIEETGPGAAVVRATVDSAEALLDQLERFQDAGVKLSKAQRSQLAERVEQLQVSLRKLQSKYSLTARSVT
ncbi:MAG: ParB/RepB/Spo0J family partition protein [Armatimonadota bacterium]